MSENLHNWTNRVDNAFQGLLWTIALHSLYLLTEASDIPTDSTLIELGIWVALLYAFYKYLVIGIVDLYEAIVKFKAKGETHE